MPKENSQEIATSAKWEQTKMNKTTHKISYAAAQTGAAFRVENAVLALLWMRHVSKGV